MPPVETPSKVKTTLMSTSLATGSVLFGLPFDVAKTRKQINLKLPYRTLMWDMYQTGGISSFYKGLLPALSQRSFKAGMHTLGMIFSEESNDKKKINSLQKNLLNAVSLTLIDTIIINPTDAIKIRLMTNDEKITTIEMLRRINLNIIANDLRKGFGWTLSKTYIAWANFYLVTDFYKQMTGEKELSSKGLLYSSIIGTATKLALTTPLDVVKTNLQGFTQNEMNTNGRAVIQHIVKNFGWSKLFAGVGPRAVHGFMAIFIGNFTRRYHERQKYNEAPEINKSKQAKPK